MASIRYTLTKFLFKSLVRPMMKKAASDPEKFLKEQYKAQQKRNYRFRIFTKNTTSMKKRQAEFRIIPFTAGTKKAAVRVHKKSSCCTFSAAAL